MKNIVVIPTYNEKRNILSLVKKIGDIDILFIDDNSPDGTADVIEKLKMKNEKLKIIKRERKMGLGSAYRAGFKYALDNGYDNVIMMDADLSHPPEKIPELLDVDADFVVGSRYIKGGKIVGWPWYRYFLSKYANIYAKTFLKMPINDLTGGFNRIKKEVLEEIDFEGLKSDGYAFQIELKYYAWKKGFKLREIPITFKEREKGKSKLSKKIVWEAFWLVLDLSVRCKV
ncbi:MAG: polyprenol monophosphomannose synthase [Caldiserica bacterium]|nr:MAG: polyprenol monophosphomannose synthase [Caldisericota bacterium]